MKTVLSPFVFGLALAATSCSSSSNNSSASNGSPSGSSGGSPSPAGMGCSTGECNESEVTAYGTCVEKACDAQYQSCFGPSYASAVYGGPCGPAYNCFAKCACGDNACLQACPAATTACQECIGNMIQECAGNSGCTPPTCGDASVNVTAPKTCADLAACCAAVTDSTEKSVCQTEYSSAVSSGDIVCNALVQGFEDEHLCP